MSPERYARELGAPGPWLLHPGRALAWWRVGGRLVWADEAGLWWEDNGVAWLARGEGPYSVAEVAGGFVAWGPAFGALEAIGGAVRWEPEARAPFAGEVRVVGGPGSWSAPPFDLPEGAVEARWMVASACGEVLLWAHDFWVYRMRRGGPPRALGRCGAEAVPWVGPEGSLALEDAGELVALASPRGLLVSVRGAPLGAWGLRFEPSGAAVWVPTAAGGAARVSAESGRVSAEGRGLPVDGAGARLDADGVVRVGGHELARGLLEASWSQVGDWLAGPGGAFWRLDTGERIGDFGRVPLGAIAEAGGRWAAARWDTGEGVWLVPAVASPLAHFRLPLEPEETVEQAVTDGDAVIFVSSDRRAWRVRGAEVSRVEDRRPRHPRPPRGVDLPVDAELVTAPRRYAWSEAGLLVAWPTAQGRSTTSVSSRSASSVS